MGTTSKVISCFLRFGELVSASIVLGILGRFTYLVHVGNGNTDSRIIYTMSIAGISILFSMILFPPFMYSFWAFPFDFAMFIMWMVAFGLLEHVAGGTCNAFWSWNYWGFFWGRFWRVAGPVTFGTVGRAGCSSWRSMVAFTFIGGMGWLASSLLGMYKVATRKDEMEERAARANVEAARQKGPINGVDDGVKNGNAPMTQVPGTTTTATATAP
ncbi:hypothetical protein B0J14DRAFT_652942 [Halenospora varia]|nr:hypothetical protein B0J14DRAFT_652942 [Halenospora varia]